MSNEFHGSYVFVDDIYSVVCINQLKLKKDGTTEVRQETQALALFQVKSTWN